MKLLAKRVLLGCLVILFVNTSFSAVAATANNKTQDLRNDSARSVRKAPRSNPLPLVKPHINPEKRRSVIPAGSNSSTAEPPQRGKRR